MFLLFLNLCVLFAGAFIAFIVRNEASFAKPAYPKAQLTRFMCYIAVFTFAALVALNYIYGLVLGGVS